MAKNNKKGFFGKLKDAVVDTVTDPKTYISLGLMALGGYAQGRGREKGAFDQRNFNKANKA